MRENKPDLPPGNKLINLHELSDDGPGDNRTAMVEKAHKGLLVDYPSFGKSELEEVWRRGLLQSDSPKTGKAYLIVLEVDSKGNVIGGTFNQRHDDELGSNLNSYSWGSYASIARTKKGMEYAIDKLRDEGHQYGPTMQEHGAPFPHVMKLIRAMQAGQRRVPDSVFGEYLIPLYPGDTLADMTVANIMIGNIPPEWEGRPFKEYMGTFYPAYCRNSSRNSPYLPPELLQNNEDGKPRFNKETDMPGDGIEHDPCHKIMMERIAKIDPNLTCGQVRRMAEANYISDMKNFKRQLLERLAEFNIEEPPEESVWRSGSVNSSLRRAIDDLDLGLNGTEYWALMSCLNQAARKPNFFKEHEKALGGFRQAIMEAHKTGELYEQLQLESTQPGQVEQPTPT